MATLILNSRDNIDDFLHCTNVMDVVMFNHGHITEILKGPFENNLPKETNHFEKLEEFIETMKLWDQFEEFAEGV